MTTSEEPPPDPPQDAPPPFTTERRDASVTEQWDVPSRTYRRYDGGVLVLERAFTDAENAWADRLAVEETRQANDILLRDRARAALTTNRAYLDAVAGGTATQADHIAHISALTRQMQGLIRLIVGSDLLDQIGG